MGAVASIVGQRKEREGVVAALLLGCHPAEEKTVSFRRCASPGSSHDSGLRRTLTDNGLLEQNQHWFRLLARNLKGKPV